MNILKSILVLVAFLLFGLNAFAQNTLTATFTAPTQSSPVVYVVERQTAPSTWVEAVRGPSSPLTLSNIPDGVHTFRVRAQWSGAVGNTGYSDPSNSVTATAGVPKPPVNLLLGVVTVAIEKDGLMRIIAAKDANGKDLFASVTP